ncbi:metallophosphoesterase [Thiomicrorhabdus sp. zzn3]|uniref:metallophosphoesterase n=1 Tax=Thiomicrorhabdus sp. zzn3 TaxID=3039775 RepID=UPI002436E556|nr:metallophosphoesterase [Thiomicrorhabdus sp. zzn3]MDG6777254.1 metallophosphoesterase [Thiomicrorhabdus sp. zzn3]
MAPITPWQPQDTIKIPLEAWLMPQKNTYFFCDLHADADAFLRSLKLSELVTFQSTPGNLVLTEKAKQAQILIGGDCFDKGPSNLALFKLLNQLRQAGADLVLLAGNHDIRVYAGLLALDFMDDLRQSHFFVRMGRKTAAFLAEIYQHYCQDQTGPDLPESLIHNALFPQQEWFEYFPQYAQHFMNTQQIHKELKQIRKKQPDFLQACSDYGLNLTQVYQAAQKAKSLFIDPQGEFAWFFRELNLLHRSGSYLFSHAGLDDRVALQLQNRTDKELNDRFKQQMREGQIFQMYYSEMGNVFRTKYRPKDWPLTETGSQALRKIGILALVNGHRSHLNGQQLFVRQGLLNFECDTQLNANCRRKSNMKTPGEAVTIFSTNGTVSALCSELPYARQFHPVFTCA